MITPSAAPQTGGGSTAGGDPGRLAGGLLALVAALGTAAVAVRRRTQVG